MNDVEVVARRYRLGKRIGTGGMGRVWLAVDEVLQREVAIKEILLPDGLTEDDAAELRMRTLREARTAAALSHPNVIKIYDVIYAEQRPWIVMEYVESRSLAQVIREDGPLPPEAAARIGLSVLAALVAAHESGVLHRDVKPGNVLLGHDDRVVLTDFGLATFDDVGSALTASGVVHGSPQFIAPERALDGTSTSAADMWSLGATLYAAVEGRAPYARPSSYATLTALATAPPDPPRNAGPLKPLLGGLLRRNPANRMKPDEVRSWLQQVASEIPPRSHVIPRQRKRTDGDIDDARSVSGAPVSPAPNTVTPTSPGPVNRPEQSSIDHGNRNRRLYNDSFGARRRAAEAQAAAASASAAPPPLDMPVAGTRPAAARPVNSSEAAFVRPGIDDERDTDRQMDLAWHLDAAAGLLGEPATDLASARTRSHQRGELRRRRARRRKMWLATTLGVAVLATVGAFAVEQMNGHDDAVVTPPSSASTGTTGATPIGVPVAAPWPCAPKSVVQPDPLGPKVPSSGSYEPQISGPSGLLSNFAWHQFDQGLVGGVPVGWLIVAPGPGITCFYDPDSTRVLGVREFTSIRTNPVTAIYQDEAALKAATTMPDYHRLDVGAESLSPGVADWIFDFTAPADTAATEAQVRVVFGNKQVGFMISWMTPEPDWATEQVNYSAIWPSYQFVTR